MSSNLSHPLEDLGPESGREEQEPAGGEGGAEEGEGEDEDEDEDEEVEEVEELADEEDIGELTSHLKRG